MQIHTVRRLDGQRYGMRSAPRWSHGWCGEMWIGNKCGCHVLSSSLRPKIRASRLLRRKDKQIIARDMLWQESL